MLDRVEKVREEHDKLEGENRFLQEYVAITPVYPPGCSGRLPPLVASPWH